MFFKTTRELFSFINVYKVQIFIIKIVSTSYFMSNLIYMIYFYLKDLNKILDFEVTPPQNVCCFIWQETNIPQCAFW